MAALKDQPGDFIRKGTAAEGVFKELRSLIVSGTLAGGSPLRQGALAEKFGVSKIPVREALRQLESAGLVSFRPRRGAVVIEPSSEDLIDLLDIRIALECRALELAVPNMIEADFCKASNILEQYGEEMHPENWSALNVQFHRCLYEPCGRRHLMKFIDDIQGRMGPYLRLNVTIAAGFARPDGEHHQILNACRSGDPFAAIALLRAHIETTQKEVAAQYGPGARFVE